jgi:putative tryptophan/tyrosine transport system substrate-binding protein
MIRRDVLTLLGGAAAAWPVGARAQQPEKMRRIAVLSNAVADSPDDQARLAVFRTGLEQLGWSDGRNVRIDYRWSAGEPERIRRNVAELVALAPRSNRR